MSAGALGQLREAVTHRQTQHAVRGSSRDRERTVARCPISSLYIQLDCDGFPAGGGRQTFLRDLARERALVDADGASPREEGSDDCRPGAAHRIEDATVLRRGCADDAIEQLERLLRRIPGGLLGE